MTAVVIWCYITKIDFFFKTELNRFSCGGQAMTGCNITDPSDMLEREHDGTFPF